MIEAGENLRDGVSNPVPPGVRDAPTATGRSHGPGVVVVVVVVIGLFDYDNDNENVPGISVTTSVLIAPHPEIWLCRTAKDALG